MTKSTAVTIVVNVHFKIYFPSAYKARDLKEYRDRIAMFLVYKHWRHISFDIQMFESLNNGMHCFDSQ